MVHFTTTEDKHTEIADHVVPIGQFLVDVDPSCVRAAGGASEPVLAEDGADGEKGAQNSSDVLRLSSSSSSGALENDGVATNKNEPASQMPQKDEGKQWMDRLCPPNTETLIVVDNMLASIAKGIVPPVLPSDYRAKMLGLSKMPASVAHIDLKLDPSVAAVIARRDPTKFDAIEHILAWDDLYRNKHVALVRKGRL